MEEVRRRDVFVTGGTGYIGQRLVRELVARGHRAQVLARAESVARVPPGATSVVGNALDASSFASALTANDTVVHLVGTSHPSPAKALAFRQVDLPSIQETGRRGSGCPRRACRVCERCAPGTRNEGVHRRTMAGEAAIARAGLTATVLRPWYVLGPGHRWPLLLLPIYWVLERRASTRERAQRLGLVTIDQMINALTRAVEDPPPHETVRVLTVPEIKGPRPKAEGLRKNEAWRLSVSNHVYKTIELVGSSPNSIDDAVRNAIVRASATMRNLRWFQVVETRGHIEDGTIAHWQVTVKVGFTLDEP